MAVHYAQLLDLAGGPVREPAWPPAGTCRPVLSPMRFSKLNRAGSALCAVACGRKCEKRLALLRRCNLKFSLRSCPCAVRIFGSLNLTTVRLKGVGDSFKKHSDYESKGIKAHFNMDESGVLSLDRVSTTLSGCVFQFCAPLWSLRKTDSVLPSPRWSLCLRPWWKISWRRSRR